MSKKTEGNCFWLYVNGGLHDGSCYLIGPKDKVWAKIVPGEVSPLYKVDYCGVYDLGNVVFYGITAARLEVQSRLGMDPAVELPVRVAE
jgi:hypothetical protein